MMSSPEALYERERVFNRNQSAASPGLGVCLSGGGNRSAAFAIGVLRAMHESGLLAKVDVISAVSGGSYALSWLLSQPLYHRATLDNPKAMLGRVQGEMFDLDGPFQRHLAERAKPIGASSLFTLSALIALMLPFDLVFFNGLRVLSLPLSRGSNAARFTNLINAQSSARKSYRQGIQATYQVFPDRENRAPAKQLSFWDQSFIASEHLDLTRWDVPAVSFPTMCDFARRAGLPSFVFNTTVTPPAPTGGARLGDRIFELGPIGLGSNSCGYLTWEETEGMGWEPSAPVEKNWLRRGLRRASASDDRFGAASPYATIRNFNIAAAISGAALSGTNIEARNTRWLLRLLNMGLEYVVPSPADRARAVRLSDGGHSENLGAYALLRRRCRTIVIVDAEHDPHYQFGAYHKLKRAAADELEIEIAVPELDKIVTGAAAFSPATPILKGTARGQQYEGVLYYVKLCAHADWLGDQAKGVNLYSGKHSRFPQEPTSDQYFQPAQFKAYRGLGYAAASWKEAPWTAKSWMSE